MQYSIKTNLCQKLVYSRNEDKFHAFTAIDRVFTFTNDAIKFSKKEKKLKYLT